MHVLKPIRAAAFLAALPFAVPALAAEVAVTSTADSGAGSLRAALAAAGPADTVVFALPLPATITLASELTIAQSAAIQGPGADQLTISGGASRLFHLDGSGKTVSISGVALTGGNASGNGGAILNDGGNLTLEGVAIEGNTASGTGGAIYNNFNGSGNELHVLDSTISGNHANKSGAIDFIGYQLVIVNSTIANNVASDSGGAMNLLFAEAYVRNSTIAGNSANFVGGINSQGSSLTFESTIVAGNTDSSGVNDLNRTGSPSTVNADHALFSEAFVPADNVINGSNVATLVGVSPMLSALADNGGSTDTMRPLPGSPVIGAGSNSLALATDQRGAPFARDAGGAVDIGAIQSALPLPPYTPPTPVPSLGAAALGLLAGLLALAAAARLRRA